MPKPRTIGVVLGSRSDLPQCIEGLEILRQAKLRGDIRLLNVKISSIHRNTEETLAYCRGLHEKGDVNAIIMLAGAAAHLPGTADAYLRYHVGNDTIVVIGVAAENPNNAQHGMAARLSISQVPKTQVVYRDREGQFFGPRGFERACVFAVTGELPKIQVPKLVLTESHTLEQALELARKMQATP